MAHIGIICPELAGHLNPTTAVARQLQLRGHQVTFYQGLTSKKRLEDAGFTVRPFDAGRTPEEILAGQQRLAELSDLAALLYTVKFIANTTAACLREVPGMMRQDKIDLLLVDQIRREGSTIAQEVGIPYVVLCNALMMNYEPDVPPFCTTWRYQPSLWRRLRNRAFDRLLHLIARPLLAPINQHRRRLGLPEVRGYTESKGPAAQISQLPAEFDFPRKQLPPNFHYVGPAIDDTTRDSIDFPFHKLDGRPLIYASLGTLQNRLPPVFATIAQACESLPVQLVISLGGGCKPESLPSFAGDPIVVEFAPQLALLQKAKLCITHAGLNTTLESLANAVPMVAIPITNDQPGVAARIAHSGAGQFIPLKKLTPHRLREALQAVLTDSTYAANAKRLQAAIQKSGGPRRAAEVIEASLNRAR